MGNSLVIPKLRRQLLLEELHEAHPGISRMKSRALMLMWWPNINKNIENKVKSCSVCQESRPLPPTAPLQPWYWPDRPWSRLHIDYAGPMKSKMFLVVIDAYSKWLDVFSVTLANSESTIDKLHIQFVTHGIPNSVVTDNATVFVSEEMKKYWKSNGIQHITSLPYHPATNGLAERAVQTFKTGLKRMTSGSLETRIARFLFNYRMTPPGTTGSTPAELLTKQNL